MREETLQRDQSGTIVAPEQSPSPDEPGMAIDGAEPATDAHPFPDTAPPAAAWPATEPATVWSAETAGSVGPVAGLDVSAAVSGP